MPTQETPPELALWMEERAELLVKTAARIRKHSDTRHGQSAGEWLLELLPDLAALETISMRSIHLMTAYALRTGAATQTEVARAQDVTTTAAANRGSSKTAREVWAEVWPTAK